MKYPKEIQCPDCKVKRLVDYRVVWAIQKGKTTSKCLKCSRFKKGETNSGGFKTGTTPWNKGIFTVVCHTCGKRLKNSKRCRSCWMEEIKKKNSKTCLICNKVFSSYNKNKFCSRKCFKKSRIWVKIGIEHGSWKGDDAGKGAMHQWVYLHKKMPIRCEKCNKIRKLEWANKDHSYKRRLSDYQAICRSCHRKYDIKYNNYKKSC